MLSSLSKAIFIVKIRIVQKMVNVATVVLGIE